VLLRAYPLERLVLALVALAALTVVHVAGPQDDTRVAFTRSIVQGKLTVPNELFDRAVYGGRSYSDKAPGISFLAVPAYAAERAAGANPRPRRWDSEGDLRLWALRVASGGLMFLLGVFLVGRAAEGLAPGTGAAAAAIFGLGTLASPLAATLFGHVAAGALGLAAFLLAARPSPSNKLLLGAGLFAGAAVLVEYQAALIALAVLVYANRRARWIALGALPAVVLLAAYDYAAFGSPFHLSYRYVANRFAERQHGGFFGIGAPSAHGLKDVLVGDRGLLLFSPVLVLAAFGLWILWRRGLRAEALVAVFVTVAFVLYDAGYFLPYGGNSPGPRFLAPALPFLALGLGPALARLPRTTLALGAASVALTTADLLTWAVRSENDRWYPGHGTSDLAKTVWVWLGANRIVGAAAVYACAVAALAIQPITYTWTARGPKPSAKLPPETGRERLSP
jgi:hypothetical protein